MPVVQCPMLAGKHKPVSGDEFHYPERKRYSPKLYPHIIQKKGYDHGISQEGFWLNFPETQQCSHPRGQVLWPK